MASMATPYISNALSRLRGGVSLCCGVTAVALIAQMLIWGVASFMDMRHKTLEAQVEPATVVSAGDRADALTASSGHSLESPAAARLAEQAPPPPNPNVVTTKADFMMDRAETLAMTAGMLGMVLMMPMLMVGVMLSAGSATPGVEKVVSAFMWSLGVSVLVLPIGHVIGLPWPDGGLVTYQNMSAEVDRQMTDGRWGSPIFYARFFLLPLACLVGVGIIGIRFSGGVMAGILPKEDMRLDPTLEKEASGMKATSLIGGRSAAALRTMAPVSTAGTAIGNAVQPAPALTAVTPGGASEIKPGMLTVTAGEAPRRLI